MTQTQIFGDYVEDSLDDREYLTLVFSPQSTSLQHRWRNNGLSADFMADYLASFFPGEENGNNAFSLREEVRGAVSYIANELLENAMKFYDRQHTCPVSITLQLHLDRLVFSTRNSIGVEAIAPFQAYIRELISGDPNELYIQRLEDNATDDDNLHSGLGLLTMANDYDATLGWKFDQKPGDPPLHTVTTCVQISL